MNLVNLEKTLKAKFTYSKIMLAIFKHLKENSEDILWMNRKQLFVDSIGSDSKELGFYSNSEANQISGIDGMPFTMVDTGLFKEGMRIDFYYRHISIRSEYHTYEMIQDGPFRTEEFFGLTDENLKQLIDIYVKPFVVEWMKSNL